MQQDSFNTILKNTKKLTEVEMGDYDAIFLV